MADEIIKKLRRSMRLTELRIKEYCSRQVPEEISRYTLSQLRAIDTLYSLTRETGEGIQLKVLAQNLSITPAAASEMVDTLVRKGVIVREGDPADRRAVRLYVGDFIREHFEAISGRLEELTGRFLKTLSGAEADLFVSVAEKFEKFTADPENFPEVEN